MPQLLESSDIVCLRRFDKLFLDLDKQNPNYLQEKATLEQRLKACIET